MLHEEYDGAQHDSFPHQAGKGNQTDIELPFFIFPYETAAQLIDCPNALGET